MNSAINRLTDGFLIKYDPTGTWIWTRECGSPANENVKAVKVAGSYVYATGYTYGAWDGSVQIGGGDQYVVKYDVDGVKQ